jgi:hypothetical protein
VQSDQNAACHSLPPDAFCVDSTGHKLAELPLCPPATPPAQLDSWRLEIEKGEGKGLKEHLLPMAVGEKWAGKFQKTEMVRQIEVAEQQGGREVQITTKNVNILGPDSRIQCCTAMRCLQWM